MENQAITNTFLGLHGIMFLTNLLGNSLVCIVVARSKCLQNFTSYLLVNMAIGDLVLGMSGSIHLLVSIVGNQERYRLCTFMSKVVYIGAAVSVYTITVLAVDRYIAIVKPLYHRSKISTGKLKVIIPLIWITSIALALPSLAFFRGKYYSEDRRVACWDALSTVDNFPNEYKIILFALMYVLPMLVIGVLYGMTFRHLWSGQNKSIRSTNKAIIASRRKLTKVIGTIIIALNICWLPWFVVDLLSSFNCIQKYDYLRSEITNFLAMANSSLNPIVYSLQSKNFRSHISKLFKRK